MMRKFNVIGFFAGFGSIFIVAIFWSILFLGLFFVVGYFLGDSSLGNLAPLQKGALFFRNQPLGRISLFALLSLCLFSHYAVPGYIAARLSPGYELFNATFLGSFFFLGWFILFLLSGKLFSTGFWLPLTILGLFLIGFSWLGGKLRLVQVNRLNHPA